ncbi:endonuclease [Candidatus Desantisbacteria bacterium CG_4_10_14_0_8_um_filter_48_22]|uniref:Endonuclease n=1 Tax=Candidatus Desantisbacteria bacterium CG_4_10_14_0_8_um_filter_48_22 TaxID=1974543 RepID=A0A2M7SA45_9BACT|nr:MAG: endonuclease [Candidatus Desantisbacteria bacterium CG02_land_8_20_14_3_00_49_13]PIZ16402.1 MAG: endonuclease [Candidatus Desantisbacteria bacterium CG_4_10_14_0_8_um_filter_48_22]PJB27642.1 MAG: endonuclease [Candidatus Desantisbacteria bacterium CG_4_9_14_3_um_filter_50_7]
MYYVYVLKSRSIKRSYVGCSNNPAERLKAHNSGLVQSTKNGRPWRIIYTEELDSYAEARRREHYFKTGGGRRRIKRILEGLSTRIT